MRLNRTGYFLLGIFLVVGAALVLGALLIDEPLGRAILLFMGVLYVLGVLVAIGIAVGQARKGRHQQWLFETGIRGKGTLVEASSQMSVNEQPLLELVLDLDVPGQERRRVTRKMLVSSFAAQRMKRGMALPVYVNPRDPDDLLVVW